MTGCLAFRFSFLDELLAPVMLLAKSIPVASFVILAFNLDRLGEPVGIYRVYNCTPMSYTATLSGLKSTDEKLLEMAFVFPLLLPAESESGPIFLHYCPT